MDKIIEILDQLIKEGLLVLKEEFGPRNFNRARIVLWEKRCIDLLAQYISNQEATEFANTGNYPKELHPGTYFKRRTDSKMQFLNSLREDINKNRPYWEQKLAKVQISVDKKVNGIPIDIVTKLCERFHLVVNQLTKRHKDRETLEIKDEYDVQDLMHALLKIFFEDIRPEEWTPSYAGSSSRMDFLLKNEQLVIETKKTRENLNTKELGNQLIIDIAHYKKHPNCKTLFCFVYDPEEYIQNPKGIESDLSSKEEKLEVKVFVAPKGH